MVVVEVVEDNCGGATVVAVELPVTVPFRADCVAWI